MTRDRDTQLPASLDDDAIGLLVRDVATGWTMPAVRLDAPSWRDRIKGRRRRMVDAAQLGVTRAGRAATAAVAITVVAALVAVIATRPPTQPGSSPSGANPNGPTSILATPLPKLMLNGELPFPRSILVANDTGDIALVDLTTGTLGASIARSQWPSALTVTGTNAVACVCITTSEPIDGYPTRFDVRLKTFTRTTTPIRDDPVVELVGTPDPRTPATAADHVWTSISFSPDDRLAYVGWSTRDGRVWHGGILVVDIGAGVVANSVEFPDMTAGEGDARRSVFAPRVLGLGADGTLFLARSWAEWGSANVETEPARFGDDAYGATVSGGAVADVAPISDAASCGPTFVRAGPRPGGGMWLTCVSQSGTLTLRRVAADGTSLGSESMPRTGFVDGDTAAVSPDGQTFYAWDPGSSTLTRIDLSTGARRDERLSSQTASVDPLAALGRWLAPAADAKSILRGALVASPDGSRLYVLATRPIVDEQRPTGSAGILVVDAATLAVIDHWPPNADLVSIALSPEGSLLYAAGLPGVDASGATRPGQGASVTVFDTATGQERLVAGQLGPSMLSFPRSIVP